MTTNIPNAKPEITPANFPALRSFLRGYFHEDVADEYWREIRGCEPPEVPYLTWPRYA